MSASSLPGDNRASASAAGMLADQDRIEMFAEQIFPFDNAAAEQYALVVSQRDALGLPIAGFDAQIAAICRPREAALATRLPGGFDKTGVEVINPWRTGA